MEDQSIIERVLAGETEAYADVVARYQGDLWRIVSWTLHNPQAAEDLVQQAFVNAYLKLDTFDGSSDFGAWLRTITRNLVRNEIRRGARESARLRRYHQWVERRFDNLDETERQDAELREKLHRCRAELAPTSARALALRYDDGLDFSAIARELDRTVEAARQLLTRTRSALRRCMSANQEPT